MSWGRADTIIIQIKWKWKLLSHVWLFVTPWTVVHGNLQARILEWVAFPSSRGSSQPRDWTQVSRIAGGFFTSWVTRQAQCTVNVLHLNHPKAIPSPWSMEKLSSTNWSLVPKRLGTSALVVFSWKIRWEWDWKILPLNVSLHQNHQGSVLKVRLPSPSPLAFRIQVWGGAWESALLTSF